jgi:hypothetical protein
MLLSLAGLPGEECSIVPLGCSTQGLGSECSRSIYLVFPTSPSLGANLPVIYQGGRVLGGLGFQSMVFMHRSLGEHCCGVDGPSIVVESGEPRALPDFTGPDALTVRGCLL